MRRPIGLLVAGPGVAWLLHLWRRVALLLRHGLHGLRVRRPIALLVAGPGVAWLLWLMVLLRVRHGCFELRRTRLMLRCGCCNERKGMQTNNKVARGANVESG